MPKNLIYSMPLQSWGLSIYSRDQISLGRMMLLGRFLANWMGPAEPNLPMIMLQVCLVCCNNYINMRWPTSLQTLRSRTEF